MAEFLEKILATTREDLESRKRRHSLEELKQTIDSGRVRRSLATALDTPGISVIAEIKRASPSKGDIRPRLDVARIAAAYEAAGAAAISVLTEERHFRGSLEDLRTARGACNLPLLRKDFIIDPYQVWEAAAAGADAVLLIVAALSRDELDALQREAAAAGLECLVETHSPPELETALAIGARVVGINNRDLKTFNVTLQTTLDMIGLVPEGVLVVSESGIATSDDVARLARAGVGAVLVGETLMRSDDPGAGLRRLLSF